MEKKKDNYRL